LTNEDGSEIKDFRKSWNKESKDAGIGGLFPALRHIEMKNMVRAGVPEVVS